MKLLRQLLIILVICFLGELIHTVFHLSIPGNIIGMILLFLCLNAKIIKLEMIEDISKFLMDHLAFFFIPAGVGLIASMSILEANWAAILGISLITTVIVIIATGHTAQLLKRGKKE